MKRCSGVFLFFRDAVMVSLSTALAPPGRRTLARQELYGCEYLACGLCTDSLDVEDFIETSLAQCIEERIIKLSG